MSTYGEDHNWDSNSQWKQLDVDNNIEVTITATDSNSGKLYSDGWRIYQTGSPQITFTAKNGAQIFSIIVTYTTNNDGILAKYGDTDKQYATGSVILVKASEFTFTVANTNGKTNGQVRISAIKVVYTGGIVETDETRVTAALGTLEETMTVTATTTFESKVNGVTLTWSTDTELPEGITFADNKLTITTRPENDLVIVFEVQGTLNQEKQTKTVTVTVKGSKAEEDLKDGFNPITAPVAGTEYYLGMMFDNTWHYFTGEVANKYYLGTTTDISGAQKLTLEQTEGGWLIKFGTQFVEIVQSASDSTKFNAVISDAQTAGHVWKWNETYSIFTMAVAGNDYFIGTYYNSSQKKTFDTMSASKISYASSSTNYPAKLGLYKEPTGGGGSTTPGGGGSETPTGDSIVYNFSSSSVAADTYVFADTDAALAFFKGVNGAAELSSVQEGFAYIYPGNTSGGGFQGNGCLKLGGSGSKKGDVTLVFTKKVKQVVINCQAWNDKNISWVNVNADADASSKAGQQPTAGSATDLTFTLETASTTVRLNSTKYTYVFSLTVYFE